MPGSRAGLWIVESQIATPGLYCVIIALARNLNYQYYLTISIFMNNNNNTFLSPDHKNDLKNFWPCPGGLNVGYSWPGVFLLGASGRMGRFFTQLLFHNPHSLKIFLNKRTEL